MVLGCCLHGKHTKFNDGSRCLLLVVASLSRKIPVQLLHLKNASPTKLAFEKMITFETLQFPLSLWVNEGKVFKEEYKIFAETLRMLKWNFTRLSVKLKGEWLIDISEWYKLSNTKILRISNVQASPSPFNFCFVCHREAKSIYRTSS